MQHDKTGFNPIKLAQDELIGNPDEYHGSSFVTPNLRQSCLILVSIICAANVINVITAAPAIFYGFRSLGVIGGAISTVVCGAIHITSNKLAAQSASSDRRTSDVGLLGLTVVTLGVSALSGIGADLLTNSKGLAKQFATQAIEAETQRIANLPIDTTLYENQEKECQKIESELRALPPNSPERDRLLIQAYGPFKEWDVQGGASKGICGRTQELKSKALADKQQQFQEWNRKVSTLGSSGSPIGFIKKQMPEFYHANFTLDGELVLGTEAVTLATRNFTEGILSGDSVKMGFSLFMFILSVVTSSFAILLIIAHKHRSDFKISHDANVDKEIKRHVRWLLGEVPPDFPAESANPGGGKKFQEDANSTNGFKEPSPSGQSTSTNAEDPKESENSDRSGGYQDTNPGNGFQEPTPGSSKSRGPRGYSYPA